MASSSAVDEQDLPPTVYVDGPTMINIQSYLHSLHSTKYHESLIAHLPPKKLTSHHFNIGAVVERFFSFANDQNRSREEAMVDIHDIVIIGMRCGNIRKDQVVQTAPGGAERIMQLANWYKIPIRSAVGETIRLRKGTLTFVRAVSCFADVASAILRQFEGSAIKGAETVLASNQLPDAMKHSGFPGLIPKRCDPYLKKAFLYAHAAYMVDFGKLINPSDTRTLKEMAVSQLDYCKASVEKEKSIVGDEDRVNILGGVGLTDPGVFKKIVDVCNNMCKVVGEPEISFETAVKNHIKNGMVYLFEDEKAKKLAAASAEEVKNLAARLKVTSVRDFSLFL